MTLLLTAWLMCAGGAPSAAKSSPAVSAGPKPPKLGVMVVVDQLASGDLEALAVDGEADFGGLEARGAARYDALYPYLGTETGPGHATLSTGTVPAEHGICANAWYVEGKKTYCVEDPAHPVLGGSVNDGRSARFLNAPTLGDTLHSRFARSRVVAISVKDRAAILLGGPSADVALWYENSTGRWTSSKAYLEQLPPWAEALADQPKKAFASGKWSALPVVAKRGLADARDGEDSPTGFSATFPHDLSALPPDKQRHAYRYTPHALEDTLSLALAALDAENLGKHAEPDLLLISISPTDYAGHAWGPGSLEKVDLIERLSLELKRFTAALDQRLGKNGWAMVVSADHGAAPLAETMRERRVPAARLLEAPLVERATLGLAAEQKKRFLGLSLPAVFLDLEGLAAKDREQLVEAVRRNLGAVKGVRRAVRTDGVSTPETALARGSTFEGRCGPVFVELQPFVVFTETPHPLGTDHASGNVYDRRVPLYVLGPNVRAGRYAAPLDPRDAAVSLAAMLGIPPPDRAEGRPAPAIAPHGR